VFSIFTDVKIRDIRPTGAFGASPGTSLFPGGMPHSSGFSRRENHRPALTRDWVRIDISRDNFFNSSRDLSMEARSPSILSGAAVFSLSRSAFPGRRENTAKIKHVKIPVIRGIKTTKKYACHTGMVNRKSKPLTKNRTRAASKIPEKTSKTINSFRRLIL
jgi:hypothetical protein